MAKQIQQPPPSGLNLSATLDVVARDKGIERSVLVSTLESAILSAARKHLPGEREPAGADVPVHGRRDPPGPPLDARGGDVRPGRVGYW